MKHAGCLIMGILLASPALVAGADQYSAVESVDIVKETTFQVLTQAEYKNLQDEILLKNSLLSKAMHMAQEDWKTGTNTSNVAFPSGIAVPAKMKLLGIYTDKARAEAEMADQQAKMPKEDTPRTSSLQKRIDLLKEALKTPPADTPAVSQQTWINNTKAEIKMLETILEKREARDLQREKVEEMARQLVLARMTELVAAAKPKQ